jgi:hypothetical protein
MIVSSENDLFASRTVTSALATTGRQHPRALKLRIDR